MAWASEVCFPHRFEGAWGQHQAEKGRPRPLGAWVNRTRFPNRQSPGHLWNIPDNLYSKTFGGWRGEATCSAAVDPNCIGGVGAAMVGKAERALAHVDGLILTEWIGAPAQIEFLSRKYCFQTDGAGRSPGAHASWWHFHRPRRAGGGHGSKRPAGWVPDELELLVRINRWDLRLFARAAEIIRRRVAASVGDALAATLPKLAPADAGGLTAWLKNCPAPTSEVAAC